LRLPASLLKALQVGRKLLPIGNTAIELHGMRKLEARATLGGFAAATSFNLTHFESHPPSSFARFLPCGEGDRRYASRFHPMFTFLEHTELKGPALLVSAYVDPAGKEEADSLLNELEELVNTLGMKIGEKMLVHHREMKPQFLIGSGKAQEIVDKARENGYGAIVLDNELSPSQQRNWEELAKLPVFDRQRIILDIFSGRAQTREARLQVELARLEYSLPRLTRAWSHLGGQGGGIGAKGEGESQLEQDRRKMWKSIDRLKREIEDVRRARATQRKDRKRTPVPNCAIVGYTNAGKSSLLRRLTGADVLVEDKLFATLDTTTRKVSLPNRQPLLLTDTVGFVRKLPHRLVEAFNATLEESAMADFLIHLLDASAPEVMNFHNTTLKVLHELGADARPTIVVLNKIDRVADASVMADLKSHFPDAFFISVHTGEGIDALLEKMSELAAPDTVTRKLRIPAGESAALARLHQHAQIHEKTYDEADVVIVVTLSKALAAEYARFAQSSAGEDSIFVETKTAPVASVSVITQQAV